MGKWCPIWRCRNGYLIKRFEDSCSININFLSIHWEYTCNPTGCTSWEIVLKFNTASRYCTSSFIKGENSFQVQKWHIITNHITCHNLVKHTDIHNAIILHPYSADVFIFGSYKKSDHASDSGLVPDRNAFVYKYHI